MMAAKQKGPPKLSARIDAALESEIMGACGALGCSKSTFIIDAIREKVKSTGARPSEASGPAGQGPPAQASAGASTATPAAAKEIALGRVRLGESNGAAPLKVTKIVKDGKEYSHCSKCKKWYRLDEHGETVYLVLAD